MPRPNSASARVLPGHRRKKALTGGARASVKEREGGEKWSGLGWERGVTGRWAGLAGREGGKEKRKGERDWTGPKGKGKRFWHFENDSKPIQFKFKFREFKFKLNNKQ